MWFVRFSLPAFVFAVCSFLGFTLAGRQSPQPQKGTASVRQIQQQYQKLVQDLYAEEAEIQQKRAQYGQKSVDDTRDTIDSLIGIIKDTPPSEDSGEPLIHYVEFLTKARDLVNTAFKALDGIADSKTSLTEKELRLQKLNQGLVKATAAMRALTDVSNAVRNPSVKLKELPYPVKDWTALDQAIEQMRKEDLQVAAPNPQFCTSQGINCRKGCDSIASLDEANICLAECNIAEDTCMKRPVSPQRLNWVARAKGLRVCAAQSTAQHEGCGHVDPDLRNPAFQAWIICMKAADSAYDSCVASLPNVQ